MAELSPKEINRISGREFQNRLPASWIIRNQEDQEDYGIDFEIEPESEGRASGLLFKVQLKGAESANFLGDGDQIAYSDASVPRFKYYFQQLQIPVIYVVYDISTKTCAWIQVQGNKYVESAWKEADRNGQKTFTLHLPVTNTVSVDGESAAKILKAVEDATYHISLTLVTALDASAILRAASQSDDPAKLEESLRQLAFHTAVMNIEKMIQTGQYKKAAHKAQGVLNSPSETINARITAGVLLSRAITGLGFTTNPPRPQDILSTTLDISYHMLRVCRSSECPREAKQFSLMFARKSQINLDANSFMALAISESGMEGDNFLSKPFVMVQRAELAHRIMNSFSRAYHRLSSYMSGGSFHLLPYAYAYFAEALNPFILGLRILKENDLSKSYLDTLDNLFPMTVKVASVLKTSSGAPDLIRQSCFAYMMPSHLDDDDDYATRRKTVASAIKDKVSSEVSDKLLLDLDAAMKSAVKSRKIETIEERKEAYRTLAAYMGIDLNSDDRIAEIVRIGIEDLDPTRVLKNCVHMHVQTTSYGMPAEMLGLHTAGSKAITCLKHGHGIEGLKLDDIYQIFSGGHPIPMGDRRTCKNCEDCTPHPVGWQYNDEWGKEQHQRFKAKFPERFEDEVG